VHWFIYREWPVSLETSKALVQSAFRCVPTDIARSTACSPSLTRHSGDGVRHHTCYAALHLNTLYNWPAFCLRCTSALDTLFSPLRSHHTAQDYTVHREALSATRLHGVLAEIYERGSNRKLIQFFVRSHSAKLLRYVRHSGHLFVLLVALLVCL
jgi:hypothetical protein